MSKFDLPKSTLSVLIFQPLNHPRPSISCENFPLNELFESIKKPTISIRFERSFPLFISLPPCPISTNPIWSISCRWSRFRDRETHRDIKLEEKETDWGKAGDNNGGRGLITGGTSLLEENGR